MEREKCHGSSRLKVLIVSEMENYIRMVCEIDLKLMVVMNSMNGKFDEFVVETLARLKDPGCLLVTVKKDGACNVMTIGWGLVGVFWRMPVFLVAVRHSRFTH